MNETGIGARVLNFIVDNILIFLLALAMYKWWSFYVANWAYYFVPFYQFFIATTFFYYTLFEWLTSRTPGKLISLSRVRTIGNSRPSLGIVLLRSLLRLTIIDAFFIPFLNRPLHDALSKTRVVEI